MKTRSMSRVLRGCKICDFSGFWLKKVLMSHPEKARLSSITRARSPLKGRHQTHAKLKSILTFAFSAPLW
jgi:hypothetical protein